LLTSERGRAELPLPPRPVRVLPLSRPSAHFHTTPILPRMDAHLLPIYRGRSAYRPGLCVHDYHPRHQTPGRIYRPPHVLPPVHPGRDGRRMRSGDGGDAFPKARQARVDCFSARDAFLRSHIDHVRLGAVVERMADVSPTHLLHRRNAFFGRLSRDEQRHRGRRSSRPELGALSGD
jgi:hypothetical protein